MLASPDAALPRMKPFALALLLATSASAQTAVPADSLLKRQLALRVEADQAARGLWSLAFDAGLQPPPADVALVAAIDSLNTAWLEAVVAERGWPGSSSVGVEGAHDAWLLAQHADRKPDFQREVLRLMETAVARGEADGSDLAYLTDRVRLAAGEPQVYGTQVSVSEDGEPSSINLEDPENVDARRAAVGLMPLDEYLDYFRPGHGAHSGH